MSRYYETTHSNTVNRIICVLVSFSTQISSQAKRHSPDHISAKILTVGYYYQVKRQELKLCKKIKAAIFISRVV